MTQVPSVNVGGKAMPMTGLGTWRSPPGQVKDAVLAALKAGYRHLDCAWSYNNENEVGEASRRSSCNLDLRLKPLEVAESGVPREDIWITSKLFNNAHRPEHVPLALQETLNALKVDYLDLYLIHWPIAFKADQYGDKMPERLPRDENGTLLFDKELSEDVEPTWKALEALQREGVIKNIGISNWSIRRIEKLLKVAEIKPAVNQVEVSFAFPQTELVDFCKKNGILVQAYAPLGSQGASLRDEPIIREMADKYKCDGANILISWLLARDIVTLPKSVTPSRIVANLQHIKLSEEDVQAIDKAAYSQPPRRLCNPRWGAGPYGADPFEEQGKYPYSLEIK